MKICSFGGGVQSTAMLVLAAQGKIDYQTFLFCNVGDDSENPDTIRYVDEVAKPYAEAHGIHLETLRWLRRDGNLDETLYQRLMRPESRSIGIPVRMSNGAPGNRSCTVDYKIRVVARWTKQHGATKEQPATVAMGISLDEFQRMRHSQIDHQVNAYPLIDLRLDRAACQEIIRSAGLPIPPKSSCWFCPFHSLRTWQEMRQDPPAQFQKAADLERTLNDRRERLGRDKVWFTRLLKPLEQSTTDLEQPSLFDEEPCDSGYCFV